MTEPEHPVPSTEQITRDGFIGTVDGADFYHMIAEGGIALVSSRGTVAVRECLMDMDELEELAE